MLWVETGYHSLQMQKICKLLNVHTQMTYKTGPIKTNVKIVYK